MVLRGNSPAKIDAQGRVKIPTAHRKILAEEFGSDLEELPLAPLLRGLRHQCGRTEGPHLPPSRVGKDRSKTHGAAQDAS